MHFMSIQTVPEMHFRCGFMLGQCAWQLDVKAECPCTEHRGRPASAGEREAVLVMWSFALMNLCCRVACLDLNLSSGLAEGALETARFHLVGRWWGQ